MISEISSDKPWMTLKSVFLSSLLSYRSLQAFFFLFFILYEEEKNTRLENTRLMNMQIAVHSSLQSEDAEVRDVAPAASTAVTCRHLV